MISENARNYENVVIRNEQEVGINNFGLDYMVGLEDEIERLNNKEKQLIRRLEDLIIVGEQVENECAVDICKMIIEELKEEDKE